MQSYKKKNQQKIVKKIRKNEQVLTIFRCNLTF